MSCISVHVNRTGARLQLQSSLKNGSPTVTPSLVSTGVNINTARTGSGVVSSTGVLDTTFSATAGVACYVGDGLWALLCACDGVLYASDGVLMVKNM